MVRQRQQCRVQRGVVPAPVECTSLPLLCSVHFLTSLLAVRRCSVPVMLLFTKKFSLRYAYSFLAAASTAV